MSNTLHTNIESGIIITDVSDHLPSICLLKQIKHVCKEPLKFKTRHMTDNKIKKMTKGYIKSSQTKLNYYKKTLLPNCPEIDHERYKEYKNKYNILKWQTCIQFYNDKCIEHKNNTCKLWKIINSIMCKLNDKTSCIDHIKINNIASYNP